MAVDPNMGPGLPPGIPPGGPQAPGAPAAPQAPLPTTNPDAMMAVLQALQEQDKAAFQQQQDAALGIAVTQLMKQQPNAAGMDASTLPGSAAPPPMPGQGQPDPSLDPTGGSYGP